MAFGAPQKPHVLIIGAGMGGLSLAQFLRKQNVSFEIFERDYSASARGQGWAIGLYMLDQFASAMPDDVPSLKLACHLLPLDLPSQLIFYPPGGQRIGVTDSPETPCVRANRVKLREILSTGIAIQWNKQAMRIEQDTSSATVWFQDGTSAKGDIVVGADGTWSNAREHVLGRPNSETIDPVPIVMISGEVQLSGEAMERQIQLAHSSWVLYAPGNFHLFCGLNEVTPDGKTGKYYWFLYIRDDKAADPEHWLRTASRQEKYDFTIDKIKDIDPKFQEIVKICGAEGVTDSFGLYYDAIIETLPVSRVTLLGDAVHPMTPFRGEGGIQAIRDAMALSRVLTEMDVSNETSIMAALDEYQKEMTKRGVEAIRLARDAIENIRANQGTPSGWGYEVRPIPEKA